jgi:hypothetical protein
MSSMACNFVNYEHFSSICGCGEWHPPQVLVNLYFPPCVAFTIIHLHVAYLFCYALKSGGAKLLAALSRPTPVITIALFNSALRMSSEARAARLEPECS